MSIDFPRGWQITHATAPEQHHAECSYATHRMLCDCDVLFKHPEYLDKDVFYGKDGQVIRDKEGSIMPNPTTDLCERLRKAIEMGGPNRAFLEELKARVEVKEKRIVALEAKCALLAASLDQSEREVENLRHDIDLYQEITKAEVERSAELQAQITSANDAWMELYGALTKRYEELEAQLVEAKQGEPVAWVETREPGESETSTHDLNWNVEAVDNLPVGTKLYAAHPVAAASIPVAIVKADHDGTKHAILRDETVADGTLLYAGRPSAGAASEWISVDERLPEIPADAPDYAKYVAVLAHWECGSVAEMKYEANMYAKTERGRAPRFTWQGRNSPWDVTHWMPLPDPPAAIAAEKEQPR
jgi:hypothetical protein